MLLVVAVVAEAREAHACTANASVTILKITTEKLVEEVEPEATVELVAPEDKWVVLP